MTSVRGWFIVATVLAFGAGAGAGLVANRIWESESDRLPSGDADGYLEEFEKQIGIESDAQRQKLRSYYDQYWEELQNLTSGIATQHREELNRIDGDFWRRVNQVLNEEQRRRWKDRTRGVMGHVEPANPDPIEDESSDRESGGEK